MSRAPGLRNAAIVFVLLAAALVFSWPLLRQPNLPLGSDVSFAAQWAHGFIQGLRDGVWYPRWIGEANRGFGAPVFVFYPPLAYYLVAGAWVFTGDVVGALRLAVVVVTLLSAASFHFAARDGAPGLAGAAGAALYILLPYHVLDLYERFALAEFVAFVWLPPIFWGIRRLLESPSRGAWLVLTASSAALVLTHLVTAYMTFLLVLPYALFRLARTRRSRGLLAIAAAGATALLCAAVYLAPMLWQRGEVHLERLLEPWFDWRLNFLYEPKTVAGYAPDSIKPWIGASAATQALLGLGAAVLLLVASRNGLRRRSDVLTSAASLEGAMHLALAACALILQTRLSSPIWASVPGLELVQFPWRFGALQTFSTSMAAACALASFGPVTVPGGGWLVAHRKQALAFLVLVASALPAFWVSSSVAGIRPYVFDETLGQSPRYRSRLVFEYIPRRVTTGMRFERVAYPHPSTMAALLGSGQVEVVSWSSHARQIRVQTQRGGVLWLRTFRYPGWHATVDGAPAAVDERQPLGAITVSVPPGSHEVEVRFESTREERVGWLVSAAGASILVGIAAVCWRKPPQKDGDFESRRRKMGERVPRSPFFD